MSSYVQFNFRTCTGFDKLNLLAQIRNQTCGTFSWLNARYVIKNSGTYRKILNL